MNRASSDLPFLFVLYLKTVNNEVICINENGNLVLPRCEFQARYGNEAITVAIARQMENAIGFTTINSKVNLADTEHHHEHEEENIPTSALNEDEEENDYYLEELMHGISQKKTPAEIAMQNDSPFRVCVAWDCIPCEKEEEDSTTAPYVRWAREVFTYQIFDDWDAERKRRAAQEKKITLVSADWWNDAIISGEITDRVSVMATKIAHAWIAKPKSITFPRKNQKKAAR